MRSHSIDTMLTKEIETTTKLQQIIQQSIDEEELITNNLLHPIQEQRSVGQAIADWITAFSGSMSFLFLNAWFFALRIGVNTLPIGIAPFDPYPFGFLTMVVSLEAIFLSCFVLISQNRESEKDRARNENDYLINAKAEIEIRSLHQKIDILLEEQIKVLYDTQAEQYAMLKQINTKLKTKNKHIMS